jgi:hypothetical protein
MRDQVWRSDSLASHGLRDERAATSHGGDYADSRPSVSRDTFLSGQEVLERARAMLVAFGSEIDRCRRADPGPTEEWALGVLDRERLRILERTLSDFEQRAPRAALSRMSQYGTSVASESTFTTGMEETSEILSNRLISAVDQIAKAFDRLSMDAESDDGRGVFTLLGDQMRAHARRMARISAERAELAPRPETGPRG